MPEDPYAYVVAAFQTLPPPDYVPGPEEPEQAPPSPIYIPYVPEPVYPEYIPPKDDVLLAEEQPLPAAASPTLLSSDRKADRPEVTLPPRKRLSTVHFPGYEARESSVATAARPIKDPRDVSEEVALTTLEGVNTRVTKLAAVQEQDTQDIYEVMEDTQGRQMEIFQRVEALVDDSQYHYETGRLVDQEARCSLEAWAHSIGHSSTVHFELQGYMTHTWVHDQRIDMQDTLIATLTIQLSSLQGHIATALGEIRALQAREQARAGAPEGVGSSTMESVFCISVRIVGNDAAYVMTWIELKKKMANKYCPRNEMKKIKTEFWNLEEQEESDRVERYIGGLPDIIHGSVAASKPKTMQEATKMATGLMDKKIRTYAERSPTNANVANNQRGNGAAQKVTCYECGAQGHFKR
nr:hypothetical protein [Tanacetum cinerariifolium]